MRQISVPILFSNELIIGKSNFAIIQHISYEHKQNNLHHIIHNKVTNRSKNNEKKRNEFINHCVKYIGLLNSVFATVNVLWQDTSVKLDNVHYYSNEHADLNYKLYNEFDLSKPQNYNDNIIRLNTLKESYNPMPMPMHDVDLNTHLNKNTDNWDFNTDNMNKQWEETFSP